MAGPRALGLIEGVAEATASLLKLFSGVLMDRRGTVALALSVREPPVVPAENRIPFSWTLAGFPPAYKRNLLLGLDGFHALLLLRLSCSAGYGRA